MISRRQVLAMAGPATAWLALPSTSQAWQAPDRTRMGGAPTAFAVRSQAARRGGKPFDMVEHCHGLGLAGVQTNPPSTDAEAIKKFRERVEAYHMHLICDPRLPRQPGIADEVHVVGLDALTEFLDGLGVGGRGIRLHARQAQPMAVLHHVEGLAAAPGSLRAHGERRRSAAHACSVRRLPGLGP